MPPPSEKFPPSLPSDAFWRSLETRASSPALRALLADEFPAGASVWPADMSRRRFLELMSASLALAGLAGCGRRPREEILPYVTPPPETDIQAAPAFYASTVETEGFGRGILVRSDLGRPTKIEGNPDHPESLGATDVLAQAAVLSLYDPDRSRAPRRRHQPATWPGFEAEWLGRHDRLLAQQGAGFALLTEPTTSPTLLAQIHRLLDRFPRARWYQHTALARHDLDGVQLDFDFASADVVFSIGADFLYQHPAALRYTRAFAQRRRVRRESDNASRLNRFYAVEATPTVTGTMADLRLPLAPAALPRVLDALARALDGDASAANSLAVPERDFVQLLAADLRRAAPRVACIAGPCEPLAIQRWAAALNARLGADGVTVRRLPALRSDSDPRCAGDLRTLAASIDHGDTTALVLAGVNPAYTAPRALDFPARLSHLDWSLHVGAGFDETAALCTWHLPESHFLEAWSDLRAFDGTASIVQPLIEPLYATRSAPEILRLLADPPGASAYDLVRETWQNATGADDFDARWSRWLIKGVIDAPANSAAPPTSGTTALRLPILAETAPPANAPAILFRPGPHVLDGRWANHPWLQELPQPLTELVWDNAALVSPAFARAHHLRTGDHLQLSAGGAALVVPVWILPGQADDCITLPLGYGRTRAGNVGRGHGFDAYALRSADGAWLRTDVALAPASGRTALVSTQEHFTLAGRDIVRVLPASALGSAHREPDPQTSLYPHEWPRDRHAWGMSIDLSTCTGCKACVIACQAENNIPVVGKDQVARGREMHWIRVDRYYSGDPANPRALHQPVPCMHCENAPCELVCPVGATVHSSEGLNEMVYNRCVGTRYCSNNCPYKVRRFNFFDRREPAGSPVYLQKNPTVTIRERGVMEKCTYCVQRINAGRIAADRENRPLRDGEVRTACQQVCPAEAIVFGDLADPASRVLRLHREPTSYALLAELNTRPRTRYLARVLNPPEPRA